jgi:hypothetical protein
MDRDQMSNPALSALSARAALNPEFMGYVIREYLNSQRITNDDLCSLLGITPELLVRLSLCKRPDPQEPDFVERVSAIGDYTLCDEDALLQVIRHVDALEALRTPGQRTMLSAARDRYPDEDALPGAGDNRDTDRKK